MKIVVFATLAVFLGRGFIHAQSSVSSEIMRLTGIQNVALGIPIHELKKRKPSATNFPGFQRGNQNPQSNNATNELLADTSDFSAKTGGVWYHNRGGRLCGISVSRRFSSELVASLGSYIREQGGRGRLHSLGSSQVIKTLGLSSFVVTAHHWEIVEEPFKIYILATNREVTIVLYDSAFLGMSDFFVPDKELNRVQSNFERLSRTLSTASSAHLNSSNESILDVPLELIGSDSDRSSSLRVPSPGNQMANSARHLTSNLEAILTSAMWGTSRRTSPLAMACGSALVM